MELTGFLARTALFGGIPVPELPELLRQVEARRQSFRKGDVLLRMGQQARRFGLVLSGTVQILREDFWGSRSLVGLAEAGDVFAESYAVTGKPLGVSVQAASAVEVLFLDAELSASGRVSRQLSGNLLQLMAEKNLMLTEKMRHMARRTTREKLMSYLSAQALRAGSPEFEIPLDRQQLADFLAVDRSAMSAALGKLRDEGTLEFRKRWFRLLRQEREEEV